jgi:hypothetical protein
MGFEHRVDTLEFPGELRNVTKLDAIWHGLCFSKPTREGDGTVCRPSALSQLYLEECQECFNSATRGHTVPAFTFEKIPPPVRRGPVAPIVKKRRGVIVQILDRFVEARVTRRLRAKKDVARKAKD